MGDPALLGGQLSPHLPVLADCTCTYVRTYVHMCECTVHACMSYVRTYIVKLCICSGLSTGTYTSAPPCVCACVCVCVCVCVCDGGPKNSSGAAQPVHTICLFAKLGSLPPCEPVYVRTYVRTYVDTRITLVHTLHSVCLRPSEKGVL